MTFKELKLNDAIIKGLNSNGFEKPTEVQAKVIPIFLANKNVFVKSSTGTGKTASFLLPILETVKENNRKTQAIIVAPTRELAVQIMGQAKLFGSAMRNIKFVSLIGGEDIRRQTTNLRDSQVVIGTPGRIQDHLNRGTLRLNNVQTIILDEADEMLKMGFKNEIDAIFKQAPDEIQVGLFSATINAKVKHLATAYMQDYEYIEIDNVLKVKSNITNTFIFTKGISKDDLLIKVIKDHDMQRTIIFSNTKSSTDKISKRLRDAGIKSLVINGDKRQSQRTRAIKMFKNNEAPILIATDVVARGIDISGIDFVINYDIARENENFVHRIGRTGRNNETGSSISFIQNGGVLNQLKDIQKQYNLTIDEIDAKEYGITKESHPSREGHSRDHSAHNKGPRHGQQDRGGRTGDSSKPRNGQKGKNNFSDKKKDSRDNWGQNKNRDRNDSFKGKSNFKGSKPNSRRSQGK